MLLVRALIFALLFFAPEASRDPLAGTLDNPEARELVLETYAAIDAATESKSRRRELRRICARESWCGRWGRVGAHALDARHGLSQWSAAASRGWLRPHDCESHREGAGAWGTRGPFGIVAAYSVRYLPGCGHPDDLDDPWTAARVAVAHIDRLAKIGARSCVARVRAWAGAGRWAKRSVEERIARARRQCGREPLTISMLATIVVATQSQPDTWAAARSAAKKWTQ